MDTGDKIELVAVIVAAVAVVASSGLSVWAALIAKRSAAASEKSAATSERAATASERAADIASESVKIMEKSYNRDDEPQIDLKTEDVVLGEWVFVVDLNSAPTLLHIEFEYSGQVTHEDEDNSNVAVSSPVDGKREVSHAAAGSRQWFSVEATLPTLMFGVIHMDIVLKEEDGGRREWIHHRQLRYDNPAL